MSNIKNIHNAPGWLCFKWLDLFGIWLGGGGGRLYLCGTCILVLVCNMGTHLWMPAEDMECVHLSPYDSLTELRVCLFN
jgi:hypothetical protein